MSCLSLHVNRVYVRVLICEIIKCKLKLRLSLCNYKACISFAAVGSNWWQAVPLLLQTCRLLSSYTLCLLYSTHTRRRVGTSNWINSNQFNNSPTAIQNIISHFLDQGTGLKNFLKKCRNLHKCTTRDEIFLGKCLKILILFYCVSVEICECFSHQ